MNQIIQEVDKPKDWNTDIILTGGRRYCNNNREITVSIAEKILNKK